MRFGGILPSAADARDSGGESHPPPVSRDSCGRCAMTFTIEIDRSAPVAQPEKWACPDCLRPFSAAGTLTPESRIRTYMTPDQWTRWQSHLDALEVGE